MVGLALKDQGIDVVAVGNGEAAVRKISDVRPDPLISMVKSALLRASAGQVASISDKTTTPAAVAVPQNNVPTVTAQPKGNALEPEPFVEDIPTRPASVKIDSATQPLAFGNLLETPATNAEEEIAYVAPNPELIDRDWQAPEGEEEVEEEEESSDSSWRRDGGNEAFANEVEKAAAETAARRKRREPWTPTREKKQDLIEAADVPEIVTEPARPPVPQTSSPA